MNAPRKNAALKSIEGLGIEDALFALQNDPKKYTADEVGEIMTAAGHEGPSLPATTQPPAPKTPAPSKTKSIVCEEWRVEFVGGEPQKLKKLRDGVKLRQEMIDELNDSANQHNPIMYFPITE